MKIYFVKNREKILLQNKSKIMNDKKNIKKVFKKALNSILFAFPIITGVIILMGLFNTFVPKKFINSFFHHNTLDPIIGALFGSAFAGNPINSYIIGGELLKSGVGLVAVTSFLVSWITVGFLQIPAEMMFLGKKFSILRNTLSFLFSIIVAIITVYIFNLL